ncbi:hypothetical protein [Pareuzebyella sediminis]|uniref:hypothetical protein n=1 Tax=Pareuzebyella sediminis TaxID=2607998 RepID=UPI0011EDF249|nr:hypothetical protein [Pareuzebyella sediminis]
MNRFIAILLLISFHAQPAMVLSVWVDYCVNNDYIREVLCINKEKPKLQCDGKCYLAQQLNKQSQKKETGEQGLMIEQSFTPVFFVDIQEVLFDHRIYKAFSSENFNYSDHYRLLIDKESDRPPKFS